MLEVLPNVSLRYDYLLFLMFSKIIKCAIRPIVRILRRISYSIRPDRVDLATERQLEKIALLQGRLLTNTLRSSQDISDSEFSVFSQSGEDGIIQWLISRLPEIPRSFVEFGVENYQESNTRFLMCNNNWSGLVIDGSEENVKYISSRSYYWQYDLLAVAAFIDKENINQLIGQKFNGEIGLLSIDIDGNDYWIWEVISVISPWVVVCEYNSLFGCHRSVSVPYDPLYNRTKYHYSNLIFGASLPALCGLARSKGYKFVGCNNVGNNAFFVRQDIAEKIPEVDIRRGFADCKYHQARGYDGRLHCKSREEELAMISDVSVVDVVSGEKVFIRDL